MRILLIGDAASPHFFRWNGFLLSLGHEVDVFSTRTAGRISADLRFDGQSFVDLSRRPHWKNRIARLVAEAYRLFADARRIRAGGYDYVNFHFFQLNWARLGLLAGGKSVFTCWGSDINSYYSSLRGMKKAQADLALRRAAWITCDSEEVRQRLLALCPGLEPAKIRLVYWGIDTAFFTPAGDSRRSELRRAKGIPEECVLLLSLRLMKPLYRIDAIIRWFTAMTSSRKLRLIVHSAPGGDSAYSEICREAAEKDDRILFDQDELSNSEIRDLYHICDLDLHFPASDATSVSMLEGMACGNALVCEPRLQAYKDLAADYHIELVSLESLDEARILGIASERTAFAAANISVLKRKHSSEATLSALSGIFS